jgi:DNA-binding NtrC family response regulator
MVMPDGINGQELAEKMRVRRPELRILYTSGYHVDMISHDSPGQEGFCFLQKPFSMQKLAKTVRDCLHPGGGPGAEPCR